MADFTHFNDQGRARMVDVGEKDVTHREAVAAARVLVDRETFDLIRSGGVKKGDVLTVAQVAGIMGAKRTPELIPMCHPVQISGVDLRLTLDETRCSVEITASVRCDGRNARRGCAPLPPASLRHLGHFSPGSVIGSIYFPSFLAAKCRWLSIATSAVTVSTLPSTCPAVTRSPAFSAFSGATPQ